MQVVGVRGARSVCRLALFAHVGFGKHGGVSEVLRVEILCLLALGVACVAHHWQLHLLVGAVRVREHLLEAVGEALELGRVGKIRLQNARTHLNIFDVTEEGAIQVLLEPFRAHSRVISWRGW